MKEDFLHEAWLKTRYLFSRAADFVFPGKCCLCGEVLGFFDRGVFCAECFERYQIRVSETCGQCRLPAGKCVCSRYRFSDFGGEKYTALGFYENADDEIGRLIYRFKREDNAGLQSFFAGSLAAELMKNYPGDIGKARIVIPPRSRRSRRKYGFDQSRNLARLTAEYLGMEFDDIIERISGGEQKKLNFRERRENVGSSFAIAEPGFVKGRNYIVIDDVATTGSTMCAVASILKESGASSVYPAALFVTVTRIKAPKDNGLWFDSSADTLAVYDDYVESVDDQRYDDLGF